MSELKTPETDEEIESELLRRGLNPVQSFEEAHKLLNQKLNTLSQKDLAAFIDSNNLKFESRRSHWPSWQEGFGSAVERLEEGSKIRLPEKV